MGCNLTVEYATDADLGLGGVLPYQICQSVQHVERYLVVPVELYERDVSARLGKQIAQGRP